MARIPQKAIQGRFAAIQALDGVPPIQPLDPHVGRRSSFSERAIA
jgi:hypothetical protein